MPGGKQIHRRDKQKLLQSGPGTPRQEEFEVLDAFSPEFRRIYISGEACSAEIATQMLQEYPYVDTWNTYGPTEVTVTSHGFECSADATGQPKQCAESTQRFKVTRFREQQFELRFDVLVEVRMDRPLC